VNQETVSFWPSTTNATAVNGNTFATSNSWKPRMRSYAEIIAMKVGEVMSRQGVSAKVAEMIVIKEMEALDDEAILSI
jgi:hypothetical protein